jgi:hypothetical protein
MLVELFMIGQLNHRILSLGVHLKSGIQEPIYVEAKEKKYSQQSETSNECDTSIDRSRGKSTSLLEIDVENLVTLQNVLALLISNAGTYQPGTDIFNTVSGPPPPIVATCMQNIQFPQKCQSSD